MSAIPELKKKKAARDADLAKKAAAAKTEAEKQAKATNDQIFNKAKAYEAEYAQVRGTVSLAVLCRALR